MLPQKIAELVRELRARTETGSIGWKYNDDSGRVETSLEQPNITIGIKYRFDTIEEVGTFRVDIFDKATQRDLVFSTTQMYQDFELVRSLYDSAQASGFDFSF